ncbi:fatty acid desaturase [Lasallia pustulata]|uniref:Fatty acid desaturase n=1 Tax=Lasallia pustulata TaxID=136370 RepID=A0A1W5D7X9_9LECA|nr:fatty acid desaturase [Lasallia pustulata]
MAIDHASHPTELDYASHPMETDYAIHPTELVTPGQINRDVGIKELREAIPPHCFKQSYLTSLSYLLGDLVLAGTITGIGFVFIPQIEPTLLRNVAWAAYGFVQGLAFVGLWMLGHECGHGAFSPSNGLNNTVGFILHSLLLTPYFSWRSTHRRHHIYANNLLKDHNYVPPLHEQYMSRLLFKSERLEELTEDSPLVTVLRLTLRHALGFPRYLCTNISAGEGSFPNPKSTVPFGNSHFAPTGSLFRSEEARFIALSDLGLALMIAALWFASSKLGFSTVALLYVQPYVWLNHWIICITFLHHTHPSLPKFEDEAWTFMKGAMATVDRDFGWVGKYLFHGIIEFHVVHHLFPRMPFYHAEEATKAIIPLLGSTYHADKQRAYLPGLWEAFTKCEWVEPDNAAVQPKDRTMWYRSRPSAPKTSVGTKGWTAWTSSLIIGGKD